MASGSPRGTAMYSGNRSCRWPPSSVDTGWPVALPRMSQQAEFHGALVPPPPAPRTAAGPGYGLFLLHLRWRRFPARARDHLRRLRGGPGGRVSLPVVVQFDHFHVREIPGGLATESHHQDGTQREVRRDDPAPPANPARASAGTRARSVSRSFSTDTPSGVVPPAAPASSPSARLRPTAPTTF